MPGIIVQYPIKTLDNRVLFDEGCRVSAELLGDIIARQKRVSYPSYLLLQHGSIKHDLLEFLSEPPYDSIFSREGVMDELLDFIGGVSLISPLLESFDYFSQNDLYSYRHILNVFALCAIVSRNMISGDLSLLKDFASGPIHDFGKICVPMDILKKSSPLTREERNIMEHHSIAGYALLGYYFGEAGNMFSVVARDHHERGDGSGYPRGVRLTNYVVEVIAVCDVYDALVSSRPYRAAAYDNRTAIEVITEMGEAGSLNWDVIKSLVCVNRRKKTHYSECVVSREKRGSPPPQNNYGVFEQE